MAFRGAFVVLKIVITTMQKYKIFLSNTIAVIFLSRLTGGACHQSDISLICDTFAHRSGVFVCYYIKTLKMAKNGSMSELVSAVAP